MKALRQHMIVSLRLHFRNRMALLYGYLFPVIFLVAFWVLYRYERVPLIRHMGELLTVTVLGGACFGLPTTMVSERERGVWRRYRLAPVPTSGLIASTLAARYVAVITAGLLQFGLALGFGMPLPSHPLELLVAFTFVTFAFLGLGLLIAMLADNVPAVQALGQCIFLPMLIIGGVAVQLASLPDWALHISAFFPGRYAVQAIQACVTGSGLGSARFSLLALLVIGAAGMLAGAKLFRWDAQQRFIALRGKAWLAVALGAWVGIGWLAEARGHVGLPGSLALSASSAPAPSATVPTAASPSRTTPPAAPSARVNLCGSAPRSWPLVTMKNIDTDLVFDSSLPPDSGVVTPIASPALQPGPDVARDLKKFSDALAVWAPAKANDPAQRVRNLLYAAGVPDVYQLDIERWVPQVVFERIKQAVPEDLLIKILYWIACTPDGGADPTAEDMRALGLPGLPDDVVEVRYRAAIYALKLLGRVLGRIQ